MVINLQVDSVIINPGTHRKVELQFDGFSIDDIISEIGVAELLDGIGKADAADHFNLVEDSE